MVNALKDLSMGLDVHPDDVDLKKSAVRLEPVGKEMLANLESDIETKRKALEAAQMDLKKAIGEDLKMADVKPGDADLKKSAERLEYQSKIMLADLEKDITLKSKELMGVSKGNATNANNMSDATSPFHQLEQQIGARKKQKSQIITAQTAILKGERELTAAKGNINGLQHVISALTANLAKRPPL